METIRLTYLKGSLEAGRSFGVKEDMRMWNVVSPKLPGYNYTTGCVPTFTLQGLKDRGLIK